MVKIQTAEIVSVGIGLGLRGLTAVIMGMLTDLIQRRVKRWRVTHPHILWRLEHFYYDHKGLKPSKCDLGSCKQVN